MTVINNIKPFKINGEDTKVGDPRTLSISNVWNANKLVLLTFPDGEALEVHVEDLRKALDNATNNERL